MNRSKIFVLIWMFFLDVHVKAEGHGHGEGHAAKPAHVEAKHEDTGCWGKQLPCPIQAEGSKKLVAAEGLRISLGPNALIEQRDAKTIQLVTGEFYVETSQSVTFKTPYARIWCNDDCKAIFVRTTDKIEVKSIDGGWVIERNGETSRYTVATGLQIVLSEVADDGKASMEFPQSMPWGPTMKQLAALYPGTLDELKPTLVKFREAWRESVEKVSGMHFSAASRAIASHDATLAQERARKAAQEAEDQRLRDLFREKNP